MSSLVRAEIDIDAPAATVWAYVTDWPRQAEWIPLTRVEDAPTLDKAWQARASKTRASTDTPRPDHWWSFRLLSR